MKAEIAPKEISPDATTDLPEATTNYRKTTQSVEFDRPLATSSQTKIWHPAAELKSGASSPTRIPILAWVLLFVGCALIAMGLLFGLVYLFSSGSLIGAPLYLGLFLLSGILFIVLATRTALAPLNSQPSPPDPRLRKQETERVKKEREPLKKNDKIFLGVIGGIIAVILISLLSF
ncbi:MAG: hypothetical protein ACFHU9_14805 [Fluviicola sp.]